MVPLTPEQPHECPHFVCEALESRCTSGLRPPPRGPPSLAPCLSADDFQHPPAVKVNVEIPSRSWLGLDPEMYIPLRSPSELRWGDHSHFCLHLIHTKKRVTKDDGAMDDDESRIESSRFVAVALGECSQLGALFSTGGSKIVRHRKSSKHDIGDD